MMVPIYFNLHHDLTSPLVCPFFLPLVEYTEAPMIMYNAHLVSNLSSELYRKFRKIC